MWEQSGVIPQFLMLLFLKHRTAEILYINVWCFLPLHVLRHILNSLPLHDFILSEKDPLMIAVYLFISISLYSILGSWKGEEHNAENSFTTSLYVPHLKTLSRWKEFIWK